MLHKAPAVRHGFRHQAGANSTDALIRAADHNRLFAERGIAVEWQLMADEGFSDPDFT